MKKFGVKNIIKRALALVLCIASCFCFSCKSASEDEMKKATEETEFTETLVGLWVTPRQHICTTQENTDAEYKKIKDAGINMVYTFYEQNDGAWMDRVLISCEKYGIKMVICLFGASSEEEADEKIAIAKRYKDEPAVIGYNLVDEPKYAMYDLLKKMYAEIKEAAPDKIIMLNFLPNYASSEQLGTTETPSMTAYQNYLSSFFDKSPLDAISFDYYPYYTEATTLENMLSNFCDIVSVAKKQNIDAWGFTQCSGWSVARIPTLAELRLDVHIHRFFGLKSYSYFLYSPDVEDAQFQGMVTYDGEITDIYYTVQTINEEVAGMKGVDQQYDFTGVFSDSIPEQYASKISDEFDLSEFASIKMVNAGNGNVLVGCFEKESGEKGLYILNMDYEAETTETIKFDGKTEYKVWGSDGIEQMGKTSKITVNLLAGEGKFIQLG